MYISLSMRGSMVHHEIWKYYPSTSKVHAKVRQNLIVRWALQMAAFNPCLAYLLAGALWGGIVWSTGRLIANPDHCDLKRNSSHWH